VLKFLLKDTDDDQTAAVVSPDTPDVLQAMMKLWQVKSRAEVANKLAWRRRRKRMLLKKQWKN